MEDPTVTAIYRFGTFTASLLLKQQCFLLYSLAPTCLLRQHMQSVCVTVAQVQPGQCCCACCRAAVQSGLFSTVCRYNMRGAGGSSKKWNKNIFIDPDEQDMLSVIQHVLTNTADPPKQLYMIGYSYGSCVAANSLEQVPEVSLRPKT